MYPSSLLYALFFYISRKNMCFSLYHIQYKNDDILCNLLCHSFSTSLFINAHDADIDGFVLIDDPMQSCILQYFYIFYLSNGIILTKNDDILPYGKLLALYTLSSFIGNKLGNGV